MTVNGSNATPSATTPGAMPMSSQNATWLTSVPVNATPSSPTAVRTIHKAGVRSACPTVQSTSTTAGAAALPATGATTPSGANPMSSGERRTNRMLTSGMTTTMAIPNVTQAGRHPYEWISHCTSGIASTVPPGSPIVAIAIARPR